MLRLLYLKTLLFLTLIGTAETTKVTNQIELATANKMAKAGDIIILQNGEWNNIQLVLNCNGTAEKPITFKAETAGKVLITGNSKVKLGGSYMIIDGLYFTKGFAGDDAVINFRLNKNTAATNCRVTNCVINDFNNTKRLDENYWVSFSGKKNRVDHCTFLNKKNLGVLMAVTLDDDNSRVNYHSIDHNYFGVRLPLASNGGEIIRVGVSQHCQYNSNTQITDNFFEHCDGETEIISIKSGCNVIKNNLFKECQGSAVLRHGDNNTVESNVFLGNNKEGTGGVRIINKGQWVVNNLFYQCRGEGFRSPLAIMNGVFNSPANRYVPVTDAVVTNNSFYNCSPISFCEGSDSERTEVPSRVYFERNIFFNEKDSVIYRRHDDMSGIRFTLNMVSMPMKQELGEGFINTKFFLKNDGKSFVPVSNESLLSMVSDSLLNAGQGRISDKLNSFPGFPHNHNLQKQEANAYKNCGAIWYKNSKIITYKKAADCKTWNDVAKAINGAKDQPIFIKLTGNDYIINQSISIGSNIIISSSQKTEIKFGKIENVAFTFEIKGGGSLSLSNLNLNLSGIQQPIFITTDTSGSSNHSNFAMSNCIITNLKGTFFEAAKSSVCDSIIISRNKFNNNKGTLFNFSKETDKKGYYNAEQFKFTSNSVVNHEEQIITMLRGGNDESTMGPIFNFCNNSISHTTSTAALIYLYGTQKSLIEKNSFTNCNGKQILIYFEDAVRAVHLFRNNIFKNSGAIVNNKFVQSSNNKTF